MSKKLKYRKHQKKPKRKKKRHSRKHFSSVHEKIVISLLGRLEGIKEEGISIESHIEYKNNGYAGEVDVLAIDTRNQIYYFYEVKCNYTDGNYETACKQYNRYCNAFPKRYVKGIFVSRQRIRRLKRDFIEI